MALNKLLGDNPISTAPPPNVEISFNNNACSGETVSFSANVTGGQGPYTYTWNFGDGSTSTEQNPNHTYESLGCGTQNFNVTLTVTDDNDETGTDAETITILQAPDISFFDTNPGIAGQFDNCGNTDLNSEYLVEVGNNSVSTTCINSYNINWGDGNTETNVSFPIDHNYIGFGTYQMVVTAIGDNGCSNSVTYTVKNATNPSGGISGPGDTLNLCAPTEELEFSITGWGGNTSDTIYEIDFGDGSPLITITQEFLVTTSNYIASDPESSLPYVVTHSYTESSCPDEFVVQLWIRNACAPDPNPATLPNILIIERPEASFEAPDEACVNQSVLFINTTEGGFGFNCSTLANFEWDFGDGSAPVTTNSIQNVSHTFTSSGTFTVTLTASNTSCGSTEFSKDICIEPPLDPMFSVNNNEACAPFTITITNSTDESQSCTDAIYNWTVNYTPNFCGNTNGSSFINGTGQDSANPVIEFTEPGIYELILEATNSCGTITSAPQQVIVKAPPEISIEPIDDQCGASVVVPIVNVDSCSPNNLSYTWSITGGVSPTNWNFINGTNATSTLPEIEFYILGDYTINVEVVNECGTDTASEQFTLSTVPSIINTNTEQTICSGTDINEIVFQSDDLSTIYTWSGTSPTGNVTGVLASGSSNTIPSHTLSLTNSNPGTVIYTVTPYIVADCPGTPFEFTITINPGPSISAQPQNAEYCEGAIADPLTFTLGGNTTGNISYQWYVNDDGNTDPNAPNTSAIPAPEGQQQNYTPPTNSEGLLYYFCVISFDGTGSCEEINTVAVPINVNPNIAIDTATPLNQLLCTGANADLLSVTLNSSGAGQITYNWYSSTDNIIDASDTAVGNNSNSFDPGVLNTAGTYYYYVIIDVDENLGCSDVSSEIFSIEVVEDPEVSISPLEQTICTNVEADLLIATVTGGLDSNNDGNVDNSDYEFQWYMNGNPVTEVPNADGDDSTFNHDSSLPAGIYEYYVEISQSNTFGCNASSSAVTITVNDGASIVDQPDSAEYCLGDTLAILEINVQNGVGTPTYQWYSNDTNDTNTPTPVGTNSNTLTPPITTLGTTYYYCIVSFSSGGCGDLQSDIAEISINEVPEVSDFEELICSGNEFIIEPNNSNGDTVPLGTIYTWSVPVVSPIGSIIGATDENTPQTNISQTLINTTTNVATVTYTVIPTAGICEGDTFTVEITVNPAVNVVEPVDIINNSCFGETQGAINIEVVGGIPFSTGMPYLFSWTGPNGFTSNNEDISNLEPGDYTVIIEDAGGCPYQNTFTISEPLELTLGSIDIQNDVSCFEESDGEIAVTIQGGTQPYTYSWTRNGTFFSNDEDISGLDDGLYQLTVTDDNGCILELDEIEIIEPPLLEVTLQEQIDVVCFGESTGSIDINVSGGRPGYTYSWVGPNGYTSTTEDIQDISGGVYTVTVFDNTSPIPCSSSLSINISQNDEINITTDVNQIRCDGDNDGSITITSITGGTGNYTVTWSDLGSGLIRTNLSPGIYTATITDDSNCFREFPIEIEQPPIFRIEPEVTQISCAGENDASILLNLQGGVDPVTVTWSDDPSAGVERNNLEPGIYSVTITDSSLPLPSCTITETFVINDVLPLQISAVVTDALDCDIVNSGSINLSISGGTISNGSEYQIQWSNNATTEDLTDIGPGTYSVTVLDDNGCEATGSWEVIRFDPLVLNVNTNTEVDCVSQTVDQTFEAMATGGVPPFNYSWSSGTVSGPNDEFMSTDLDGVVIVTVTDSFGCSTNFSLNVEIPVLGDPGFESSSFGLLNYGLYAINDPIQFTNTATGDFISILWDFGDGNFSSEENPVHTYLETGTYVVIQTVTYPFGCVYTFTASLIIEKGYNLIMPNAFTPNEDGLNDFFGPEYIGLDNMEFNVYDTWGSLIYSENGEDIRGWDGKINKEEADNGNYHYTFSAETFYGDIITLSGTFVFIK